MTPLIDGDVIQNYTVLPDGKVYSLLSKRYLKGYRSNSGYIYYTLKNKKKYYAHHLVAYFFIPRLPEYNEVNHKDFNRLNNSVDNLEWVTSSQNIKHAHSNPKRKRVESYKHPNTKLSIEQILEILNSTDSQRITARKYNTSARTVHNIRKSKRHSWAQKGGHQ